MFYSERPSVGEVIINAIPFFRVKARVESDATITISIKSPNCTNTRHALAIRFWVIARNRLEKRPFRKKNQNNSEEFDPSYKPNITVKTNGTKRDQRLHGLHHIYNRINIIRILGM